MQIRRKPRRGAAIVETALVLSVFLMMLFGLFEYSRFLMVLQVGNNACRMGSRYAAVNVSFPTNFDTTDYTNPAGVTYPSIQSYTKARMGSVDKNIIGFAVAAYPVDPAGLALTPPVIRSQTLTAGTYPDPFNQLDPNHVPWNQASFSENIAVSIKGTYTPITPVLIFFPHRSRSI